MCELATNRTFSNACRAACAHAESDTIPGECPGRYALSSAIYTLYALRSLLSQWQSC